MPFYITCPSCQKSVANTMATCDGCGADLTKGAQFSKDSTPPSTSPASKKQELHQNIAVALFFLAIACGVYIYLIASPWMEERHFPWNVFFGKAFLPFVIGAGCIIGSYFLWNKDE